MPRKRRQKKKEEVYTLLSVRVDSYEARLDASVNYHVHAPQHAFNLDDDDPLYPCVTHLTIVGTSTYPEERANVRYEVTIYGDDAPSRGVHPNSRMPRSVMNLVRRSTANTVAG